MHLFCFCVRVCVFLFSILFCMCLVWFVFCASVDLFFVCLKCVGCLMVCLLCFLLVWFACAFVCVYTCVFAFSLSHDFVLFHMYIHVVLGMSLYVYIQCVCFLKCVLLFHGVFDGFRVVFFLRLFCLGVLVCMRLYACFCYLTCGVGHLVFGVLLVCVCRYVVLFVNSLFRFLLCCVFVFVCFCLCVPFGLKCV